MPRIARTKLTQRMVDALKVGGKEQWLMDADVIGLGVRIRPNAKPAYAIRWVNSYGQTQKQSVCYASVPLIEARKIAVQKLAMIARGQDPAAERRKERHKTSMTELFERVFEEDLSTKGRSPSYCKDWQQQVRDHINPTIGHRIVSDVSSSDIDRLLSKLRDRPALHNRVRSVLTKGLGLAVRWGYRVDNPATGSQKQHEAARERLLSTSELDAILQALDADPCPTSDAIRLLALTGARPKEMLSAKWEDIDLELGVWTKPAQTVKQRRTHVIPLDPVAVRALLGIQRGTSPYVFPSRGVTGHLVEIKRRFAKVLRIAGLEQNTRPYDLRKAFATRLMATGSDLRTVMSLTGHSQASVLLKHYAQVQVGSQREALRKMAVKQE
jgi:integrase